MRIEIDKHSGFCFGVVNAINKTEEVLSKQGKLYCLGDIVHNNYEVKRLEEKGLITINHEQFFKMKNCTVLLRAHGEPPLTYEYARKNNITLIDATCPVVLKLQERIKEASQKIKAYNGQLLIYGKKGHAEVIGLLGQTDGNAIVIEGPDDLGQVDYNRPITVFSQTTKPLDGFHSISELIKAQAKKNVTIKDTICRQVANRIPHIREFAARHKVILFVSGKKSSNGKALFEVCKSVNPQSYFISSPEELKKEWLKNIDSVGICGATSTPQHLMEAVSEKIKNFVF